MTTGIRVGDIIEFATPRGLAYAQYTHRDASTLRLGQLIRVLPGLYQVPVDDLTSLTNQHELFFAFYLVDVAVARGLVRRVGNAPIPAGAKEFPLMRAPGPKFDKATKRVLEWWVWDGQREYRVGPLTPQLANLSPRSLEEPRIAVGSHH
jgi:hypothetical protein